VEKIKMMHIVDVFKKINLEHFDSL